MATLTFRLFDAKLFGLFAPFRLPAGLMFSTTVFEDTEILSDGFT